ncbi:MAG: hypothetical protein J6M39_10010 [Lachnospiraceae bacterium]|nr:hypothetical protein [Lachnospiraceae bacterium]
MKDKHFKKYVIIIGTFYFLLVFFFNFQKRTTFSVAENRNTMPFPSLSFNFFNDLDNFLIDTVPSRDKLIDLALLIKKNKGISTNITIIDVSGKTNMNKDMGIDDEFLAVTTNDNNIVDEKNDFNKSVATKSSINKDEQNEDNYNKNTKEKFNEIVLPNNTVIITEKDDGIQCTTIFSGVNTNIYINAINNIKRILGDNINLYTMIVPSSSAFYLPNELSNRGQRQLEVINKVYNALRKVKTVNIYNILNEHKNERLYLYSDTHWAQRGAFYACKKFAEIANVDFKPLTNEYYEEKTIKNFVGSYYRYTEDARLLTNPETFYYYVPRKKYDITFLNHIYHSDEYSYTKEYPSKNYFDESKNSYRVFIGGDNYTTIIKTDNQSNRKLLILKDSNGNCIAPNLFYSFDEIFVTDYRYTPYNLSKLIRKNKITDVLIETTIGMLGTEGEKYEKLFTEGMDFKVK